MDFLEQWAGFAHLNGNLDSLKPSKRQVSEAEGEIFGANSSGRIEEKGERRGKRRVENGSREQSGEDEKGKNQVVNRDVHEEGEKGGRLKVEISAWFGVGI